MISKKMLITSYEYSYFLASQGINGLNHNESLITPPGGDNPANWILGHIITSRSNVLAMLKLDPPWDFQRCKPYLPDAEPISVGDEVENFEEMKTVFVHTQTALLAVLWDISDEKLQEPLGDHSLGEELADYAIHEAYHAGQLGILKDIIQAK